MKKEARYKVGDELEVISTGEIGKVKSVAALLGDGYNLYVMDMNGKEKMYSESNLSLIRKTNPALELDVSDVSSSLELDLVIEEIIHNLNLVPCKNEIDVIRNACVLQSFIALSKEQDRTWEKVGKNVLKNSIYHGVVDGNMDNISSAFVFHTIMKKLGIDVKCIACNDEDGHYYLTNVVNVGDVYYYFDAYLERSIYKDRLDADPNAVFEMCCAGLGSKEYQEFFKPMATLDLDDVMHETSLPENISKSSLDLNLIDHIFGDMYEG